MREYINSLSARSIQVLFGVAALLMVIACGIAAYQIFVVVAPSNDECLWEQVKGEKNKLYITDVVPGGVTDVAGITNGDTLLSINGDTVTYNKAQVIINSMSDGEFATYLIKRGSKIFTAKVEIKKVVSFSSAGYLLSALIYILVGYLAIYNRPHGVLQQRFALYCYTIGFFFSVFYGGYLFSVFPKWVALGLFVFSTIVGALTLPWSILFFQYFPTQYNLHQQKTLTRILYGVSIFAFSTVVIQQFFFSKATIIQNSYNVILSSFYPVGLVYFVIRYFKQSDEDSIKYKLKPVVIGTIIGLLAQFYTIVSSIIFPGAIFINKFVLLPIVLVVSTPLMLGYAIFRYGLMDMGILVRRSLSYTLTLGTLALLYVGLLQFVSGFLDGLFQIKNNKIITGIGLAFVVIIIEPLKRRVEDWVAKIFYQKRIDHQKSLLELSQTLPGLINHEEIHKELQGSIKRIMNVEVVAIILLGNNEEFYSTHSDDANQVVQRDEYYLPDLSLDSQGLLHSLLTNRTYEILELPNTITSTADSERTALYNRGFRLIVPMIVKDSCTGIIAVSGKKSDSAFAKDDADLLLTVASQAAIAFENARLHETEVQKQKMEDSIALARKIQLGLLPSKPPVLQGLDIAGTSIPAEIIGGDYYDFIVLSQTKLLAIVADVSGKGMSAALYMSKIQGMMQMAAHTYATPKEMLVHVNKHIYNGMERNSYVTMCLALFDTQQRNVTVVRAGHTKPILCQTQTATCVESIGLGVGLNSGVLFEKSLQEITIDFPKGSTLLLYSDGLNEATNSTNKQYGDSLLQTELSHTEDFTAQELVHTLVRSVTTYCNSELLADDCTIVAIKST